MGRVEELDEVIMAKDAEKAEKTAKKLKAAKNKACSLIQDAKSRYIKSKTRARSRKAAEEKDSLLNSPRFDVLKDYDRREDIVDSYGWEVITEQECDRLEALWDEREEIKNHIVDGIYEDEVTTVLNQAILAIADLWDEEIEIAEKMVRDFEEQIKEMRRQGYNV